MKRRGFLGGLLMASPVVAVAGWSGSNKKLEYKLRCSCGASYDDSVDLEKPILKGTPQCPKCLMVMPFPDDLGERIYAAQGRDKYGNKK